MLRFVPDYLKTKKIKKLLFTMIYVTDRFKTQKMCDKAILENGEMLKSVLDSIVSKAVDNYSCALEFVTD